jgi:hypothetical protein
LFEIVFTEEAERTYKSLKGDPSQTKRCKAVKKTLQFFSQYPRHNSLHPHEYSSIGGPDGEKIFEAHAEQRTPAAYRVFWYYGPARGVITIIAITPYP